MRGTIKKTTPFTISKFIDKFQDTLHRETLLYFFATLKVFQRGKTKSEFDSLLLKLLTNDKTLTRPKRKKDLTNAKYYIYIKVPSAECHGTSLIEMRHS